MTPVVGKFYKSHSSDLVVVAIPSVETAPSDIIFSGLVVDPGKAAVFTKVGDKMPLLSVSDFGEFDPFAYKRCCFSYLETLKQHQESKVEMTVTPKDAIWAAIGLLFVAEMRKEGLI